MDINRFNFWQTLPVVVEAISLSDYVAFDLEMTGISASSSRAHEHTEAAAYSRAVEAARTFQVLQFGMTCLAYEGKQKEYRARTFTFHLTPEFVPPNMALAKVIDRKLVLSYRSFLFLKENNFSFEKAFSHGVPYLSRSEGQQAKTQYLSRCRRHRATNAQTDNRATEPLKSEYQTRHDSVVLQTAFRYIIEALVGGPFAADIDAALFLPDTSTHHSSSHLTPSRHHHQEATRLHQTLLRAEHRLRARRPGPVLVGHNPFLDLCFLHETFLRPLPADAAAFRRSARRFFPRVLDTKHLACALGGQAFNLPGGGAGGVARLAPAAATALERVYAAVVSGRSSGGVGVVAEEGFDARAGGARAHDAGLDSWMTGVVVLAAEREVKKRVEILGGKGTGCCGVEGGNTERGGSGGELFRELNPFGVRRGAGGRSGAGAEGGTDADAPLEWEVWKRYGNKLRLGSAGVMDLEAD